MRRPWQVLKMDAPAYHYKSYHRERAGLEACIRDIFAPQSS